MKAVILTGHGGVEKLEYRDDVPVPTLGPGDVLVAVGASAIANGDIWIREGAYGDSTDPTSITGWRRGAMTFPRIQGANIVGRIADVGAGVSPARLGQRVLIDFVLRTGAGLAEAELIGSERDGGYAEYVAVPNDNAHTIDSNLTDPELVTFPTAYVTALRMLERARLSEGESILITGASGGVGCALVQLARIRGARVIGVVSKGKEELIRSLGATGILIRGSNKWPEQVGDLLRTATVDVVADVVGGEQFPDLLTLIRPEGRYVTAGAIAGPVVSLDLRTLYLKHLEMIGSSIGTRDNFLAIKRYIEKTLVRPVLGGTYSLKEIRSAQLKFKSKDFVGRLSIVPNAPAQKVSA